MAGVLRQVRAQVPARAFACVKLQGVKKDERQAFKHFSYNLLSVQKSYLVFRYEICSSKESGTGTTVCVDGRRRLVWDSTEEYLIKLDAESLSFCSKAWSRNVLVRAMEIGQQREKKSTERKLVEVIELD